MRVAVVGAGVVGVHCALALQERGAEVVVIDRGGPAAGASKGNAGVFATYAVLPEAHPGLLRQVPGMLLNPQGALSIRWSHLPALMPWLGAFVAAGRPEAAARNADALQSIMGRVVADTVPVLQAAGSDDLLRHEGVLYIYRSEAALRGSLSEWQEMGRRGVPYEILDAARLREVEPAISEKYSAAVLLSGVRHTINPEQLVRRLFSFFLKRGGHFEQREVRRVEEGPAGARLHYGGGEAETYDAVVIACGAHSAILSETLGYLPPLDTERGYNTTLPEPGVALRRPVCVAEAGYYMTPMSMGLRVGGKVELGGLKARPRWSRSRAMVQHATRVLPGLNTTGGKPWMGYRPSLPDTLPVIGTIPGRKRSFVAFGHGHLGLTLGATTGRLLADMMTGQEPPIDVTPFSPMRFA